MKNAKHTPGPWKPEFTSNDCQGNTYIRIRSSESEIEANAALIAAAPELLEALELAYAELERIRKGNDSHEPNCVSALALGLAQELITKAKGEV